MCLEELAKQEKFDLVADAQRRSEVNSVCQQIFDRTTFFAVVLVKRRNPTEIAQNLTCHVTDNLVVAVARICRQYECSSLIAVTIKHNACETKHVLQNTIVESTV